MDRNALCNCLLENGLLSSRDARFTPLSGGVSCEILLVDDGRVRFVVKRALEKLKVKDDWFADVRRNVTEQQFLRYVGKIIPAVVPEILYADEERFFFCMEMIEGGMRTWKSRLFDGEYSLGDADLAGKCLGTIHRVSLGDQAARETFATAEDFYALRIEPYLLKTGSRHPDLNKYFIEEAERIADSAVCLIHGDYSPKNLMVGDGRLVILDCEVACYGDPVFDLAFLINHLLLKAACQKERAQQLFRLAAKVWDSYRAEAGTVVDEGFEERLCHLLPMLMLARVDGKSPLEYLNQQDQQRVREFCYSAIPESPCHLNNLVQQWTDYLAAERV